MPCGRCRRCADRQQKVADTGLGDRDVFGLKVGPSGGAIQVFQVRGGRVVERVELGTDPGAIAGGDADVLHAALMQFYELRVPAAEINLPEEIEDVDAMAEWLSARAGRKVRILVPQRGDKRALVELATRNAELSYRTRFNETTAAHFDALETLRSRLNFPPSLAASTASTFPRSRAARRLRRWWCAKTAG